MNRLYIDGSYLIITSNDVVRLTLNLIDGDIDVSQDISLNDISSRFWRTVQDGIPNLRDQYIKKERQAMAKRLLKGDTTVLPHMTVTHNHTSKPHPSNSPNGNFNTNWYEIGQQVPDAYVDTSDMSLLKITTTTADNTAVSVVGTTTGNGTVYNNGTIKSESQYDNWSYSIPMFNAIETLYQIYIDLRTVTFQALPDSTVDKKVIIIEPCSLNIISSVRQPAKYFNKAILNTFELKDVFHYQIGMKKL